jgi:hypothetical protein
MISRKRILVLAIAVIGLFAAAVVLAVHDKAFELDGSIIDNVTSPNTQVDWANLFDVPANNGVPTPKVTLPTGFSTATFVRDFVPGATDDSTTFATGSKDTLNIGGGGWQCKGSNNVTDKGDILNSYATAYTDPSNGHTIVYFALEISSNEGTKDVGFWFLKSNASCTPGKNAQNFTGDHVDGDLLVVSEYTQGGGVSTIKAFRWNGGANGSLDTTPILTGVDCQSIGGADQICATVNKTGSPGPLLASANPKQVPWLTQTKTSKPSIPGLTSADLDTGEFFEGGIDLTAAGQSGCFTEFLADTRSSAEPGATLYDYALGNFNLCDMSVGKFCATGVANNPQLLNDGLTLRTTFTVPIASTKAGTISNVMLAETPSPALGTGESCAITAIESKAGADPNTGAGGLTLPYTLSGTTAVKVYKSIAGNTSANVTIVCDTRARNPFSNTVKVTSADVGDRTHTTGQGETCSFVGNPTVIPSKCCQSVTVDPDTLQVKVCVNIGVSNNSNPPEPLVDVTVVDDKVGTVFNKINLDASGSGSAQTVNKCYFPTGSDSTGDPVATSQITFTDKLTSVTGKGGISGTSFSVAAASLPTATCPLCGGTFCSLPQ